MQSNQMLPSITNENWPKWGLTVEKQNLLDRYDSEADSGEEDKTSIIGMVLIWG